MPAPYAFDPELAAFASMLPSAENTSDDSPAGAVALRAAASAMLKQFGHDVANVEGLVVDDRSVDGYAGAPAVPLRIYRREGLDDAAPCVIFIHGGGFVQGSIFEGPSTAADAAKRLRVVCVDVEYRLAPEHPAPAAIEDSYAALSWVAETAEAIGVDASRIIVVGGSAGGGIAAGLTLMARDLGGPAIAFQLLDIPELDDRLETMSMQQFVDTPMFTRGQARQSWHWYLGGTHGPETSPYAVPGRVEDLSGLPPAYVNVAQFDPLRDEGIAYASRLLECGVNAELHVFPGTFHGSVIAAQAQITQRQSVERFAVLANAAGVQPW